ncbi:hypothetical protein J1TS3_13470 [Siminovitchia fordii]|uniref:Uncharacterized protein n=1 Tax=Siminovitchia fordii TaxID=254759 RepID=A0ABQ4K389_9BACI|nr:hypothetical protein J1TS3_13470 [Siminovitchia fordii]
MILPELTMNSNKEDEGTKKSRGRMEIIPFYSLLPLKSGIVESIPKVQLQTRMKLQCDKLNKAPVITPTPSLQLILKRCYTNVYRTFKLLW